ncbi:MAG: hypothetical protein KTR22_04770 [Flavobacteriaceae bacterium]|nr:hypothetical protein [Flavobacteriaceae bacterium]
MHTDQFVKAFYAEKQSFLELYISENTDTEVGQLIKSLGLSNLQQEVMKKILDRSFTDIFYTILLGLDGSASIGGVQEMYDIKDEKGNQISGEIEGYAYEYFHNSDSNL